MDGGSSSNLGPEMTKMVEGRSHQSLFQRWLVRRHRLLAMQWFNRYWYCSSSRLGGLGCSNKSCGGMSRSRRPSRHSSSRRCSCYVKHHPSSPFGGRPHRSLQYSRVPTYHAGSCYSRSTANGCSRPIALRFPIRSSSHPSICSSNSSSPVSFVILSLRTSRPSIIPTEGLCVSRYFLSPSIDPFIAH